jgi:DNA-binding XRE family transcriptional regulator
MYFSDKIKYVRAELMLTQAQLAKELGVSFASVSRWELGELEPNFLYCAAFDKYCKLKSIKFKEISNGK